MNRFPSQVMSGNAMATALGNQGFPTRASASSDTRMMSPATGPAVPARPDPRMMLDLPPAFAAALAELGQILDLDGDGTPDIAVVPIGGNAMANMRRASRAPPAAPGPSAGRDDNAY